MAQKKPPTFVMKKLIIFLFIINLSNTLFSQSTSTFGLFPTINHGGSITRKWDYNFYYFSAFNLAGKGVNHSPHLFIFYSEQALTYKFNHHWSLTGSYVREEFKDFDSINFRDENRFYAQGTYTYPINHTQFKHRLRYDGRFIQNHITKKAPYTSRIRYLFGLNTPIVKSEKLYLSSYNEFFFNTYRNEEVTYSEDWLSCALGLKSKQMGNFEIGPLYIFWINNQNRFTNLLYLQLTWSTHVNLIKSK